MRRIVVGLSFGLLFVAGFAATTAISLAQAPQVIRMSVKKFEFSEKEINVRKGVPVVIEITSEDRIHGFSLPAFGARSDVIPGEITRITFTPDKAGSFEYLCDIFCGDGHEDVNGTLIVKD